MLDIPHTLKQRVLTCIVVATYLTGQSHHPRCFLFCCSGFASLVKALGGPSNLPAITVAYDNICNVEKMRITRKPLPLPPPYNKLWMNINHGCVSFSKPHQCNL